MAIADMFLKMEGVTGEASDADHKGEIEVVSWSWGMEASAADRARGQATGKATISELHDRQAGRSELADADELPAATTSSVKTAR